MTHRIRFRIVIRSRDACIFLATALMSLLSVELGSETLTMKVTFPAPSGIYNSIVTTGDGTGPVSNDTVLNRNGGNTILVSAANTNGWVGLGTDSPTARLTVSNGAIGGNYAFLPKYANWKSYGEGDGRAAIYNSNEAAFRSLMIVGNNSSGIRSVRVLDNMTVANDMAIGRDLWIGRDLVGGAFKICRDVGYGAATDTLCPPDPVSGVPSYVVMTGAGTSWYAHSHDHSPFSSTCGLGTFREYCDFPPAGIMRCCKLLMQ